MKKFFMDLQERVIHIPELLVIYFAPAAGQIGVIALAVVADTLTGIWAAKKKDEKVTSKRLSQVFPKLLTYFVLIMLAHGIENEFKINVGVPVRSLVSLAILGNELMSIDENLKKATGKGLFQKIVQAIKRK